MNTYLINPSVEGSYHNLYPFQNLHEKIPLDIFKEILFHLDDKLDIQSAVSVSHLWQKTIIEITSHKELRRIKNFARFLATNLDKEIYPHQIKTLFNLPHDENFLNSLNLIMIKSSALRLKELILNMLKDLESVHLDDLELEHYAKNVNKPKFFENLFNFVNFYKEIDTTKDNERLECIIKKLNNDGQFEKAIEAANKISVKFPKYSILHDISLKLFKNYQIDRAIKLVEDISYKYEKFRTMEDILSELVENNKVIHYRLPKDLQTCRICVNSVKNTQFSNVVELAKGISCKSWKSLVFRYISIALFNDNQIDEAIEQAKNIPSKYLKSLSLSDISQELVKKGQLDKAIETIKSISNDWIKFENLYDISSELIKHDRTHEVIDIAENVPFSWHFLFLFKLFEYLFKLTKDDPFDKFAEIVEYIDQKLKSQVIQKFVYRLRINTRIDYYVIEQLRIDADNLRYGLIELAKKILYKKLNSQIPQSIIYKLSQDGYFDEAIEIAESISNKQLKVQVLQDIVYALVNNDMVNTAIKLAGNISLEEIDSSNHFTNEK